ncbi:MAG: MmgE/PrpD family protein [Deltaproteobacteria bacterium]|nr:MmgE/PrpD family protein [Deltaproteobacteria bacterium]
MAEGKDKNNRMRDILMSVKAIPELAQMQLNSPFPTGLVAQYIAESQKAALPEEVLDLAKRHFLDTFASLIVSSRLKPAKLAQDFALFHGGNAGPAHLLTTNRTTRLLDAVFANAITAHAAEINDFCPSAFVQPGPPVISTVFAIGELIKASGEEILRAMIAGYEMACRFPKALGIENLRTAGLSSHGVGPTFGAACAAASLLKLSEEQIRYVLAYCVQQASGSFNWIRDEEHVEKAFLFAGMPARNGATAALLVHHGFTGVSEPFAGSPNWLLNSTFIGPDSDIDKERLVRNLGVEFELPLVGYKRYPVGGPIQPSVEGLLKLIQIVDRRDIVKVDIRMPGQPDIFYNSIMPALNLPYLAAVILEDGDLTFDTAQSHERMVTPSIQKKMKSVSLSYDPKQEREPRAESAIVEITLKNGSRENIFVEHVLGFPERPMSREDVETKALGLIVPVIGIGKANKLVDMSRHLDEVKDIQTIIPLLMPKAEEE